MISKKIFNFLVSDQALNVSLAVVVTGVITTLVMLGVKAFLAPTMATGWAMVPLLISVVFFLVMFTICMICLHIQMNQIRKKIEKGPPYD